MRIEETFSEELSGEEADRRFDVHWKTYEINWKLFPDALACLRSLQGGRLSFITNGGKEMHRAKIRKLNLEPYFSTVVISREVNLAKPDKAIFEWAAREARTDIHECVYVGDRLEIDALSSQRAGMTGIWLDRKGQWSGEEVGVPVIRNLTELPKLLEIV